MKKQDRKFAWVDPMGLNSPTEFYPTMRRGDAETRLFAETAGNIDRNGWSLVLGSEYTLADIRSLQSLLATLENKLESNGARGAQIRWWVVRNEKSGERAIIHGDENSAILINSNIIFGNWRCESPALETREEAEELIKEWNRSHETTEEKEA